MNIEKFLLMILCGTVSSMLFTACQSEEIDNSKTIKNTKEYSYKLVADVNVASDTKEHAPNRGLLFENPTNSTQVHSKWGEGDELIAYALSDNDQSTRTDYSKITSKNEGSNTQFEGTISSVRPLTTDDEICFFYPGTASTGSNKTIIPEGGNTIKKRVQLDMSQQDGTIETIGKRFDYQWKVKKPKKVSGSDIILNVGTLERVVSIWGMRFADSHNKIITNIDSIYVYNLETTGLFDLSTGKFVNNSFSDKTPTLSVIPTSGKKLITVAGKYAYVAAMPGTYTNMMVMVYTKDSIYVKDFKSVTLEADKIYHTDVLQMKNATAEPYVEVAGVKWARGNFIHYGPVNGGYWGIAPAQWWISRRAVQLNPTTHRAVTSGGVLQSSQFEVTPNTTTDDVDLFRFGLITEALDFKLGENYHLRETMTNKEFYKKVGIFTRPADSRDEAYRGDIVWYYTMLNHQKYRYPRAAEMKKLYDKANAIPAYCYTDKGTIVYGAYFTNNTGTRTVKFPALQGLSSYVDVTRLVQANKGLFLPITGRRDKGVSILDYRKLYDNSMGYGLYMTSDVFSKDMSYNFFFGKTEWNFTQSGKQQAMAIRPVWDSGDKGQPDTVYPDFVNIR